MGDVVPLPKSWRSGLRQQQEKPAAVIDLPMEREVVFEIDEALEARLNAGGEHGVQRRPARPLPDVGKVRRSVWRSVRQADESTAAIEEVLQRK